MKINYKQLMDILNSGIRFFYKSDDVLEEILKLGENAYLYSAKNPSSISKSTICSIPKNGVYVMFEKGENVNGLDRVVRVGINEKQDRLLDRILTHYEGTMNTSVFRKHIGSALSNPANPLYQNNSGKQLEQQISNYIRENISFVVIEVEDKLQRETLEKQLITTFADMNINTPSANWLGKYCSEPKICKGNLWNVNYLKGYPMDPALVNVIDNGIARP